MIFRPRFLRLYETFGNLFDAPQKFAFAHCISADLCMSAGIARDFLDLFGNKEHLRAQNPVVGGVVFLKTRTRIIYYLVTKKVCIVP